MHPDLENRQRDIAARLKGLASETQPPYNWLEFRRRAQERSGAARQGARWGLGAAAASLLIIVAGIAVLSPGPSDRRAAGRANAAGSSSTSRHPSEAPAADGTPRVVDPHVKAAERWLASLPPEPVIVRFGTRVAVNELEDRIAQVDDLLSVANTNQGQPGPLEALQQERGRLVKSLAQVRYAETFAADIP